MRGSNNVNHRSLMSAAHAAGYAMAVTESAPADDAQHAKHAKAGANRPAAGVARAGSGVVSSRSPDSRTHALRARAHALRARTHALREWLMSVAFPGATA